MSERNIRHVEEVFGEPVNGVGLHKPQNILDRKSSFNMFKNKQAPKPPQGQMPLPKIGNYQPKILLEKTPGDVEPLTQNHDSIHAHTHRAHSPDHRINNNTASAPLVIGDKDIPLRIGNHTDDEQPVPAPRRKRRAPGAPDPESETSNPVFGRSVSQRSDEERLEMDIEEHGGDINFGPGIDNPAFNTRERNMSGMSSNRSESSSSWAEEHHRKIQEEHQNNKKGITYPYIPPPDYEDEEMTMDFDDDFEPTADYDTRSTTGYRSGALYRESEEFRERHAHRALEGDDFGKYMQEEDYEFDAPKRPVRRPPPGGHFLPHKNRPVSKPNKNMDKKVAKSKKKQAPDPNMKRNTIRDFTFSDSKIGWGDRTVKSTSAKGRYIKHNKERQRVDNPATFNNKGGSYEEFLRVKNGLPLESPNSSDSGVDTNEERNQSDMYYHSQPKQLKHGNYDEKPSMWQRLTWKFRKNPNAPSAIPNAPRAVPNAPRAIPNTQRPLPNAPRVMQSERL